MNAAVANALLELLGRGPATPTQLQQHLSDAGAPMHYEAVMAALRSLAGSGAVVRHANCTWSLADSVTRPQDHEGTTMSGKIECQRCGESKAAGDMLMRKGKPAKTCRACFAAAKAGEAKPVKAAAKAVPVPKRTAARPSLVVDARVRVELTDADGKRHAFALTLEQATELREALA